MPEIVAPQDQFQPSGVQSIPVTPLRQQDGLQILESRIEELTRALDELRDNTPRVDELAQCWESITRQNQIITQQAQEIAQLRTLVARRRRWLQTNYQPLTQTYEFVKSDVDTYTFLVQRVLDQTIRTNGSIPSAEFNRQVQALGMASYLYIQSKDPYNHGFSGFSSSSRYYYGLSWKSN
jgi:TolA-binding protein